MAEQNGAWRRCSVRDTADRGGLVGGPFGSSLGTKDYVEVGVPVIRGQNLGGPGRFNDAEFVYVSEQKADELARNLALPGDLVLTQRGTLGQVGIVPAGGHGRFVISQSQMRLRPNPDVATSEFLYYVFRSPAMLDTIDARAIVTGVPHINLGILGELKVTLPPIAEQRAIAGVLGALDDKIESNRRIVATVDDLVRAEFAAAAADPDGQEVPFAALAQRISRPADPSNLDGATPYIGLEHMPRGSMVLDDWGVAAGLGSGKSFFERGDVLFGKLRPYFRKVGVAPVTGVCSTDVLVLRPRRGLGLLVAVAASEELIAYASNAASGTKMPRASWEYVADFKVTVPGAERSASFEATVAPALDRALTAVDESRSLAAVRDALLPELLSGRLRVREAEEMVGSV